METFDHDLKNLFIQLGMDFSEHQIDEFIENNKINSQVSIDQASCWNKQQSRFLKEGLHYDSEWCMAIDTLSQLMSKKRA